MAVSRTGLKLIDSGTEYNFPIAIDGNGKQFLSIDSVSWEPGDSKQEFRTALHPWDLGLASNRIDYDISFNGTLVNRPSRTYTKANADLSWPGIMVPPPELGTITLNSQASSFAYSAAQLSYIGDPGGSTGASGRTYAGAPTGTPLSVATGPYYVGVAGGTPIYKYKAKLGNYNYVAGGQYLWRINADYTATQIKDFGAGKQVYGVEVFNSELIIAMGESEKIWKMTTAEAFTQASNNTYAIALGKVGEFLWRADDTNRLSSCADTPLTLASWTPASPNQYTAGDSTYSITDIIEYAGIPVVLKPDGVYFPDAESVFHNQAPQLSSYPHEDNGKGSFVAWGYLWVPSIAGLFRITHGECIPFGPELTGKPDFRFWVRDGIEWAGDIYLLCNDEASVSNTAIFKMVAAGDSVVFHELVQAAGTTKGYFIFVSTIFTNPTMMFGYAGDINYFKLGRGGGRHIDDPNYTWGASFSYQSGDFVPGPDLAVESYIEGLTIVCDCASDESITASYEIDRSGSFTNFLDTQDGSGTAAITNTSGFSAVKRYATVNDKGQMFNIKLTGSQTANKTGTDRLEIREIWVHGFSHPALVDVITIGLYADKRARVRGISQGNTAGETLRLFRNWYESGTILTMELNDYEENNTIRVRVVGVKKDPISTQRKAGNDENNTDLISVILRRTDFASNYAEA